MIHELPYEKVTFKTNKGFVGIVLLLNKYKYTLSKLCDM